MEISQNLEALRMKIVNYGSVIEIQDKSDDHAIYLNLIFSKPCIHPLAGILLSPD